MLLSKLKNLLSENGPIWLFMSMAEKIFGGRFKRYRLQYERSKKLPGFNTTQYNHYGWTVYDWSKEGEEWNDSPAWKQSILDHILTRYIQPNSTILEIGPGAGKWSEPLSSLARKLILVDLTEVSIEICKNKLTNTDCDYYVNNGYSLNFLQDESVNYVWSFDVFVHIAPKETASYITEIGRVLTKGGIAVIHHPKNGGLWGGFRSSVTNEFFLDQLAKNGLRLINQFSSWGTKDEYSVHSHNDLITVFAKI
jgi:ubiquinone/menaquinone biosynthesis C-methylase UbiE